MMQQRIEAMRADIRGVNEMEQRIGEMLESLGEVHEGGLLDSDQKSQRRSIERARDTSEAKMTWNALQAIQL